MAKVKISTNWIRDLYYDPCDPDPWIYLELAFPALIQAIWEFIQWDWEDFYEGTRGKSWQKDVKGVIKNVHWQPPKSVSNFTKFLFIAEAGVQRLGWMFMVAMITANAFIRWASLITNLPQCNETITSVWGRSTSPLDGRPYNADWMQGPVWSIEAGTMFPYVPAQFTVPPGGAAYYTTFQRYAVFVSGSELKVQTRLIEVESGATVAESPVNDPSDPENRASSLHGKVKNPGPFGRSYEFQVKLADGQHPLVWQCIGDFVSLRIFDAHEGLPTISLPYLPLPQPSRRTAQRRPWRGA